MLMTAEIEMTKVVAKEVAGTVVHKRSQGRSQERSPLHLSEMILQLVLAFAKLW